MSPAVSVVAVTVAQHPSSTAEAVSHHKPQAAPASWDEIHHRPRLFPAALHRNKIHVCVHLGPKCKPGPKRLFFLHASVSLNQIQQVNQSRSNDVKGASNSINVHLRNLFGLIMAR